MENPIVLHERGQSSMVNSPSLCNYAHRRDVFNEMELDVIQNYRDQEGDSVLSVAARYAHAHCCEVIYNRCPELLYKTNEYGSTALHLAARNGHITVIRFLIYAQSKMEAQCEEIADIKLLFMAGHGNDTALHYAARFGFFESAKVMIEADPSNKLLRMTNIFNETAMHLAVHKRRLDIVTLLVEKDPNYLYSSNHKGQTPLLIAMEGAYSGDKVSAQIRKLLMEKQSSQCEVETGTNNWTLLHHAAYNGDVSAIEDIIRCYPNWGYLVDQEGQNLFHIATRYRHLKVLKYALAVPHLTEDVLNWKDIRGNTALHVAVLSGNPDLILCLLDHPKVNKLIENLQGEKALDMVSSELLMTMDDGMYPIRCACKGDVDFFKAVQLSILRDCKDVEGDSLLAISARMNHLECFEVIYKRCPELLYHQNNLGFSTLHVAALNGSNDIVQYLITPMILQNVEDIEIGKEEVIIDSHLLLMPSYKGLSALHSAVEGGHLQIARDLIRNDRGNRLLTMVTKEREAALHIAVRSHNINIVRLLVEAQPDIDYSSNNSGRTPHLLALEEAVGGANSTAVEIRRYLIKKQPRQCKVVIGDDNWTLLHHATLKGDVSAIKEIIDFCPDSAELVDIEGQNFLHLAIRNGLKKVVRYILGAANISEHVLNLQDIDGNTPLHHATSGGNISLAQSLLYDPRVKIQLRNKQGINALAAITFDYDKRRAKYGFANTLDEKKLKNQSDFDLLVGALICTVSFTAGITVPGGFNNDGPNKGNAILYVKPSFQVFMVSNTMAFALSLYAVFTHFCTRHLEEEKYVRNQLYLTSLCSLGAIFALMIAFISGSFAVLEVSRNLSIIICVICCLFFLGTSHPTWRMVRQLRKRRLASDE